MPAMRGKTGEALLKTTENDYVVMNNGRVIHLSSNFQQARCMVVTG
jgi:hypothetical protein